MARPYESSTDYEEHITYVGATIADDYDNPDYLYDREQLAYDGGTTDIQGGYASTAITYNSAVTGWNGSKTVTSTATGTGTGAGTATEVVVKLRTATGDGTGTSTNVRVIVRFRTATGTGEGTSLTRSFTNIYAPDTGQDQQQPPTKQSAFTSTHAPEPAMAPAQARPRHDAFTGDSQPAQEPAPAPSNTSVCTCSAHPPTTKWISPAATTTTAT